MDLNQFKDKLRKYKEEDITIIKHAKEQADFRDIKIEEVKENIVNPDKLVYFEEQQSKREKEIKYNCYFAYSENYYHRYILVLNRKVIIVTIIGVNRRWQYLIEKRK